MAANQLHSLPRPTLSPALLRSAAQSSIHTPLTMHAGSHKKQEAAAHTV